jgi:hypothetical protein
MHALRPQTWGEALDPDDMRALEDSGGQGGDPVSRKASKLAVGMLVGAQGTAINPQGAESVRCSDQSMGWMLCT